MKILIMCGGRGRRLGDLTQNVPKPLMIVGGKTILQRKIEHYSSRGFKDFILCTGYLGDQILDEAKKLAHLGSFTISDSGESAGILQRLYDAQVHFEDKVLVTYGDTFADLDLTDLERQHNESLASATIVVGPIQNPFGLVDMDSENKVLTFREKPVLNYYIGYAVIAKESLTFLSDQIVKMPDGLGLVTYYRLMIAMDKLFSYYHNGMQATFNTREELKKADVEISHFFTTPEER